MAPAVELVYSDISLIARMTADRVEGNIRGVIDESFRKAVWNASKAAQRVFTVGLAVAAISAGAYGALRLYR